MSDYDSSDPDSFPSGKKDPIPLKFMKKTKKVFSAGFSRMTLSDTTKALEIVTEQISEAMARFEALEESVKNQEDLLKTATSSPNFNFDSKLLKTSQSILVEMENIGKHVEDVIREERVKGFKDSFHQTMLGITAVGWFSIICVASIDFYMKAFIIAVTILTIKVVGEKYVTVKQVAESNKSSYQPIFSRDLLKSISRTDSISNKTASETVSRTVIHRESLSNGIRQRVTSVVVEEVDEIPKIPKKKPKKMKKLKDNLLKFEFDPSLDIIQNDIIDKEREIGMSFNFLKDSGISFDSTFNSLSDVEKKKFTEFKELFQQGYVCNTKINKDLYHDIPDDFNFLRFLQADKFKVNQAVKRLLETIEFRQKSRVYLYPKTIPRDMDIYRSLRPRVSLGPDQANRLVVIENVGKFLGNKLVPKALTNESWIKCYAYENQEYFYEFRKNSIKTGRYLHKFVFIADTKLCKFSNVRKLGIINTLKVIEAYIPEIVDTVYIINAPSFAYTAWKIVSKVLDPTLAAKIKILGSKEQSKVLLNDLGPEVVPQALGGNNPLELP